MKLPKDISYDKEYLSKNHGPFKITKYISNKEVYIRFLNTGTELKTQSSHIRTGGIKDLNSPAVLGVGYLGYGEYTPKDYPKAYSTWKAMLQRCYDPKWQEKQPTYRGCTVTPVWHSFQTFAKWYQANNDYTKSLCLDKDTLIPGNKEYSPDKCILVSHQENKEISSSKHYSFKSPDGEVVKVFNLSKFARDNNLHATALSRVNLGKQSHHLGWTKV